MRKVINAGSFNLKFDWILILFFILLDMEQWFGDHGPGMGWCLCLGTRTATTRSIAATFPSDRSEPVRIHRCVLLQYKCSFSIYLETLPSLSLNLSSTGVSFRFPFVSLSLSYPTVLIYLWHASKKSTNSCEFFYKQPNGILSGSWYYNTWCYEDIRQSCNESSIKCIRCWWP